MKQLSKNLLLTDSFPIAHDDEGVVQIIRMNFTFAGEEYVVDVRRSNVENDRECIDAEGPSEFFDSLVSALEDDYWEQVKEIFWQAVGVTEVTCFKVEVDTDLGKKFTSFYLLQKDVRENQIAPLMSELGCYGTKYAAEDGRIIGFPFSDKPAGWKKVNHHPGFFYPKKIAANESILQRIRAIKKPPRESLHGYIGWTADADLAGYVKRNNTPFLIAIYLAADPEYKPVEGMIKIPFEEFIELRGDLDS